MKIKAVEPGKVFPSGAHWHYDFTVIDGLNRVQRIESTIDFASAAQAKQAMRERVRRERIRNGLIILPH